MAEKAKSEDGEEKAAEKGGGKKKLIIIIVAVVLLAVIGAGAFFALSGKKSAGGDGEEAEAAAEEEAPEGEEGAGELPGGNLPLETFIVNLQVKGSFLKVTMNLEFAEPEPPHNIEADTPKIRDAIIRVLSAKTANEVLAKDGKEKLAEELKKVVNEVLESEDVVKVYFTEFIVQ